jgi:hypothetical protein
VKSQKALKALETGSKPQQEGASGRRDDNLWTKQWVKARKKRSGNLGRNVGVAGATVCYDAECFVLRGSMKSRVSALRAEGSRLKRRVSGGVRSRNPVH